MKLKTEMRITIIYLIVGILWISLSDHAILMFEHNIQDVTRLQTYKGWIYVISTALLIFFLIRHETHKRNHVEGLLRDKNEKLSQSLKTIREIQDEKRSSQIRFLNLFQNISEGFAWLDTKGNFKGANPAFLTTLHFSSETLKGKHCRDICPPESKMLLNEINKRGFIDMVDTDLLDANQQKIPVSLIAFRMPAPTGNEEEIWIIIRDNHEWEERMREQRISDEDDRLKSSFLANISHEVRTPMNSIIGFAELLGNDSLPDERRKWYSRIITENAEMLLTLIDNMLDISRLETGVLKLSPHKTNLNKVISEVYELFLQQAHDKGIELTIKNLLPTNDALIVTDEAKIKQVLINILSNALKFTDEGIVTINSQTEKNFIQITIHDTGVGVAPDEQEKIFEHFNQVDNSSTRKYGGAGLGLAISKGLVNLLEGEIRLESTPGKGTIVFVKIPQNPHST